MTPPDADQVHAAIRLGWLVGEVRGRSRPGAPTPDEASSIARGGWTLPLGSERSVAERLVEVQQALQAVAAQLQVDLPYRPPGANPAASTFGLEMQRLGKLLCAQRKAHDPRAETTWRQLAKLLYHWDAAMQDRLLATSDHLANGYELGRALAEPYWALDPAAPSRVMQGGNERLNPVCWEFLLGDDRRDTISLLLGRLSQYFPVLSAPAVAGSVQVWGKVATDAAWRSAEDSLAKLYTQTRNWYSLLVASLDPETLLKPYALLRSWRIFKATLRVFAMEAAVGFVGAAATTVFGLLVAYAHHEAAWTIISAGLGVTGLSTASLQARLKTTTQSTVARLRQDLSTDLVAEQITVTPTPPKGTRVGATRRSAIGSRTVTASLPP
ncbi:MAG: hypothetical protein ACRD0Z_06035 [Acidimicrobiales bacterium]